MNEDTLIARIEEILEPLVAERPELQEVLDAAVDLHALVGERAEEAETQAASEQSQKVNRGEDLARAVSAFAEWQTDGYERAPDTKATISRQLWYEVSDHVHAITGQHPPSLGSGPA
jgi:hypothetical protein